jgi:hypothetical protein
MSCPSFLFVTCQIVVVVMYKLAAASRLAWGRLVPPWDVGPRPCPVKSTLVDERARGAEITTSEPGTSLLYSPACLPVAEV